MTRRSTTAAATRFGVISDAHVAPPGSPPYRWHAPYRLEDSLDRLQRAVDACLDAGADVLLLPGDVTQHGDPWSIGAAMDVLARCGRPAWIAGGNHDTRGGSGAGSGARAGLLADALAAIDGPPVRGVAPAGVGLGPIVLAGTHAWPADDGRYEGERPSIAAGATLLVWLSHFPVLPGEARLSAAGLQHPGDARDRADIERSLRSLARPTLVLSGHLHVRDTVAVDRVLQLGAAALVEPPFEVGLVDVTVDGPDVRVSRTCRSVEAWDGPAPVLVPAQETWWYRSGSGWRPSPGSG